jgi:hypothetical protein
MPAQSYHSSCCQDSGSWAHKGGSDPKMPDGTGSSGSSPTSIFCFYSRPATQAATPMAPILGFPTGKPRTLRRKTSIVTRPRPRRTRGNAHAASPGRKSKSVPLSAHPAEPKIRTLNTPGALVVSSVERPGGRCNGDENRCAGGTWRSREGACGTVTGGQGANDNSKGAGDWIVGGEI